MLLYFGVCQFQLKLLYVFVRLTQFAQFQQGKLILEPSEHTQRFVCQD